MPKLKTLNSKDMIKIFKLFGFEKAKQKGSHIKLSRKTGFQKQVLIIPNEKNLAKGTLKAIFNQASRFVSQEKLQKHFYTKN